MKKLEPPVKRYLSGKLPSHSGTKNLSENFKNLHKDALQFILQKAEFLSAEGKPTKKAAEEGLVDVCERKALWNLENLSEFLKNEGNIVERKFVNQELPNLGEEPAWGNLSTLGTYFSVSASQVGKWLDALGLRDENGMGNQLSVDSGLARVVEMNAGGKKTRKIAQWNLQQALFRLTDAGHPLDFDYSETLKGKGRNSDVQVRNIDDVAKEFAREFVKLYKNRDTRPQTRELVRKTSKTIQKRAEELLKKPGFITNEEYLKNF